MTREEHARLETLDTILRSEDVRERIGAIVERVHAELGCKKEAVMTWESLPLAIFGRALPPGIRSAWVFVLRAGADTGTERHPNSHQRMMSFEGSGNMQTGEPDSGNRMFWLAIQRRRSSDVGFQSRRMSGIGRW